MTAPAPPFFFDEAVVAPASWDAESIRNMAATPCAASTVNHL